MWKLLSQRAFNHGGKIYDRFASPLARELHERVVDDVARLGLPSEASVLDASTGPGRLAIALAGHDLAVTGIDLSPSMIDRARQNSAGVRSVTFEVGDVAALPFPEDSFDLVVSTAALHHWSRPALAARELYRVLRPSGQLWIYDARPGRYPAFTGALEAITGTPPERTVLGRGWLRYVVRLSTRPKPAQARI
ncbi:class I SAM-dependent methyltransferase [Saccharothrix sp. AJ9571]|nr:class I SAM-dependent methyltransferase [Saccharothrix sp. AJ9571]